MEHERSPREPLQTKLKNVLASCIWRKMLWRVLNQNRADMRAGPVESIRHSAYHLLWTRASEVPPVMLSEICLAAVLLNSCSLLKGSISSTAAITQERYFEMFFLSVSMSVLFIHYTHVLCSTAFGWKRMPRSPPMTRKPFDTWLIPSVSAWLHTYYFDFLIYGHI